LKAIMVSEESVEKACAAVGQFTDEEIAGEFDRFFRAQPAVCEFIVEITHESGQHIQELSLFLSYMVFKTMEAAGAAPVTLAPQDIEAAYQKTESWMNRINLIQGTDMEESVARTLQQETEPHLLQYIIAELNEPTEDGSMLNDEEKGEVFFVLKTVITSLCTKGENL
jgi:hypothetical protein